MGKGNVPARVEHIGHERRRRCRPGSINDVCYDGRQGRRHGICDNGTGCRPGEYFNLARCIEDDVAIVFGCQYVLVARSYTEHSLDCLCPLFYQIQDLIELSREKVQGSQDTAIWTEVISSSHRGSRQTKRKKLLIHCNPREE